MISRQFLLSALGISLLALLILSITVFMWNRGEPLQEIIFQFLFAAVLFGISGFLFYKAYGTKNSDDSENVTEYTDIMPFKRFLIHPEVHAINQLIIYNEYGNMVGRLFPGQSWLKYLEPLINFLPFKHYIESENGHLMTLDVRGFFNKKIFILNESGHKIGTIRQNFFKSLFKFHVIIEVNGDRYETNSDVLFGELEIENIVKINSFNVPVEITERFKRFSERLFIIEEKLETDEGKVGLAVLCFYAAFSRGK